MTDAAMPEGSVEYVSRRFSDYSPIDWFVARSMISAAESNVFVDKRFKEDCTPVGEKRSVFVKYINEDGEPLAYLSQMVSDSLKSGLQNNRLTPYLSSRRERTDILHIIESAMMDIEKKEANLKVRIPVLQDAADMLLISMSICPVLKKQFDRYHSNKDLTFKAKKYYGQASIDFRRIGQGGISHALEGLHDDFEAYLFVMKAFAKELVDQTISN